MGCNAWHHPSGCICGWGGANYGPVGKTAQKSPSVFDGRHIWRSFVNPNARCPECREPAFYYQSKNGGRVFFDDLGPPWPKHPCTDRRNWRWPIDGEFKLKEDDVIEPKAWPDWQHEGWVPVAEVETRADRSTRKARDRLKRAVVSSAINGGKLDVVWPFRSVFDWSGPVMMRPDPCSLYRVVFETIRWDGHATSPHRLIAVRNDLSATVPMLLSRLRDKR